MPESKLRTIDDLVDLMFSFWRSAVLRTALDLHVVEHLGAGRDTVAAFAEAEAVGQRGAEILLDGCCAIGLTEKTEGRYRSTALAERCLGPDGPLADYVSFFLADPIWSGWMRLTEVVRSGTPLPRVLSVEFWEMHARVTFGMAQERGRALCDALVLGSEPTLRVLDVGCGSGGIGLAIAEANAHASVTGVDQAPVLGVARENAARLGLSDRVRFRPVDIIGADHLGGGPFDLAILSGILPGYDETVISALLSKVAAVVDAGGRIVVAEPIADEARSTSAFPLLFAVQMLLTNDAGTTRTRSEFVAWLSAAGFERFEQHRLEGHWDAIVGHRSAV